MKKGKKSKTENPEQKRLQVQGLPPKRISVRDFRAKMRAAMEDGDALFVMNRDYHYSALVIPLHLDRWNATERKEVSKRARRQFDLALAEIERGSAY